MMLPEFELLMPKTLPEALAMLRQNAPDVAPLAGGTSLLIDMRGGLQRHGALVNVAGLGELRSVRLANGYVELGGGTTLSEILRDPLIAAHAPALGQAARSFANPLVRNRATVGGNLSYASPAADTAPPLLVLGAEVELTGRDGTRSVPLEDFFVHVRQTVREPHELLTAIRWPAAPANSASAFRKLALRKADAISVISAAVWVEWEPDGRCKAARIALGAAAPTPVRAYPAEAALKGQLLTSDKIAEAADLAAGVTCCIDDIRGSAAYRQRVTGVLVRRLLESAVASAGRRA